MLGVVVVAVAGSEEQVAAEVLALVIVSCTRRQARQPKATGSSSPSASLCGFDGHKYLSECLVSGWQPHEKSRAELLALVKLQSARSKRCGVAAVRLQSVEHPTFLAFLNFRIGL